MSVLLSFFQEFRYLTTIGIGKNSNTCPFRASWFDETYTIQIIVQCTCTMLCSFCGSSLIHRTTTCCFTRKRVGTSSSLTMLRCTSLCWLVTVRQVKCMLLSAYACPYRVCEGVGWITSYEEYKRTDVTRITSEYFELSKDQHVYLIATF